MNTSHLQAIPSIDELLSDATKAATLPPEVARTMLAGLAGLLPVLIAQSTRDTGKVETPQTERWLDAEEVADILGVPISWVYESARNGRLKSVRYGRYVKFNEGHIREYRVHGGA